jgi:hypothetical protein
MKRLEDFIAPFEPINPTWESFPAITAEQIADVLQAHKESKETSLPVLDTVQMLRES